VPDTRPDIDQILQSIREEARARGAQGAIGAFAPAAAVQPPVAIATHGLPRPDVRHAADLLALPLDVFLEEAYRLTLGRPPDAAGAAHYQRAMLRGAITRMEVLGRLRFSPEGRKRDAPLPGVALAFAFATLYRVPVAGPLLAFAARLARLAPHCQDRSTIESVASASGDWMKR
jgi:O-antigen chain-terminating methyltransferase